MGTDLTHPVTIIQVYAPTAEAEEYVINSFYTDLQNKVSRAHKNDKSIVRVTSVQKWDLDKEWTIVPRECMDSDKGTIEGNNCVTSAMRMICTYPTQNSSRPNPLTNAHTAKLTAFYPAGNSYLASKTANHFLVLA